MTDTVFFDLDGTLTDPSLGITNSVMHALERMGREVPPREELYSFIGPPLITQFMEYCGISKKEAEQAVVYYREHFSEIGLFENVPYEGVGESISRIKASGKKVCVATSKPEVFAKRILDRFGLSMYFDFVCGATMDEKRTTKREVIEYALEISGSARENTVMVGDRRHDIEGAKACCMRSIGVTWGFGSKEELEGAGADFTAGSFVELEEIIRKL